MPHLGEPPRARRRCPKPQRPRTRRFSSNTRASWRNCARRGCESCRRPSASDDGLNGTFTMAPGISPSTLRDLGPAAALRALAQRSPVPIRVVDEGIGRASAAIEAAIYFCAREAIQNATKHAGPRATVTTTLGRRHGAVDLTVSDDGVGLSPDAASTGTGIRGMHDRIEAVGGRLDIFSEPGRGTCVRATIPHEEDAVAGHRAGIFTTAGVSLASDRAMGPVSVLRQVACVEPAY